MKRLIPALLLFSLLLSPLSNTTAEAATPPHVLINGEVQQYDQPPVILNGTTMVPFRAIFEAMGAEVSWYGPTKKVGGVKGNIKLALQVGSKLAYKGTTPVTLPQPVQLINGRAMVPLRFVSETLGAEVAWDGKTNTVKIISPEHLLMTAATTGDLHKIKQLLALGADVNARDKAGRTPLMLTLRNQQTAASELLLQRGASVHTMSSIGDTPLSYAISYNHDPRALNLLIKAGVDVTDTGKHGTALLNTAIVYNNTPMLKALLAAGVDPNLSPDLPPLVHAATKGNAEAVQALLAAKADPLIKTSDGYTAMVYALSAGRQDVITLLKQAGDTTTTLPEGFLPFDEGAEVKRLQGGLEHDVIDGLRYNDYGLAPTEAIMFIEMGYEDDRESFFRLSEAAQKQVLWTYFRDHHDSVSGITHCYTYITFHGDPIVGADLNHGTQATDVKLTFGPRVPLRP